MQKEIIEYQIGVLVAKTRKGNEYKTEINLLSDIVENEFAIEIIQFGQSIYIRENQFNDFVDILRAALDQSIKITENE